MTNMVKFLDPSLRNYYITYETKDSTQTVLHVVPMSNNYTSFLFVCVFKYVDFIIAKQVDH